MKQYWYHEITYPLFIPDTFNVQRMAQPGATKFNHKSHYRTAKCKFQCWTVIRNRTWPLKLSGWFLGYNCGSQKIKEPVQFYNHGSQVFETTAYKTTGSWTWKLSLLGDFWNNWDPSNSLILFLLPKTGTGCSWILKFIKNWNQHSSLSIQITAKHW